MLFLFQDPEAAAEAGGESEAGGNSINDVLADPNAALEAVKDFAIEHGPGVLGALVTLIIGLWVVGKITKGLRKAIGKTNVDPMLANFLGGIVGMLLKVILVIAVLGMVGVETTSFAAILAAAGFAIGMALSGTLGNFAAGVMILLFRPFKNGDFIEAAGEAGVVEEISVFMTKMRTGDNKQILVPNSSVTGGNITNYSAKPTRRIDLVVGISYDDDIKKAHEVLNRIMEQHEKVMKDPAWTIAVSELGDNSVNFVVRPWVASGDYWPVRFELIETIKLTFDQEGLNFPFPQRDVHLYNAN
ncbi:MAG: mechanosensitive ion channel protein [Planctomycetes bacterium]|nr:mechanosensitive ion channel protein [Planctomycetota bacterium]